MFKLYTTSEPRNRTEPFGDVYSAYTAFDIGLNEEYSEFVYTDTQCALILTEAYYNDNLSNESYELLAENVMKTVIAGIANFVKKMISYMKDLVQKLVTFFQSMTTSVDKWIKNVAPRVEEKLKNTEVMKKLEFSGYKWNEQYLLSGILDDVDKYVTTPITTIKLNLTNEGVLEAVPDKEPVTANSVADKIDGMKSVLSKLKDKASEIIKKKEEEKKDAEDDKEKDEFKAPEPKSKNPLGIGNINDEIKKISEQTDAEVEALQKRFYMSTDVMKEVTDKAKGGKTEPETIKSVSANMINSKLDFIKKSPNAINDIKNKYDEMGSEFENLEKSLSDMENEESNAAVKAVITESINRLKGNISIFNRVTRLNVKLIEECTKEYMTQCNKVLA